MPSPAAPELGSPDRLGVGLPGSVSTGVARSTARSTAAPVLTNAPPGVSTMAMPASLALTNTGPPVRAESAGPRAREVAREASRNHRRRQQRHGRQTSANEVADEP